MIALMAGFTGLSITRGASAVDPSRRKALVATSAIVLGGGIWSMHFVAMLGLQLPVLFYYDALVTLISALIAILIVGLGLIVLHFRERSRATITLAGLIIGSGILGMHYVGMAGMQLCRATYSPLGIVLSVGASLILSILAVWLAYGDRSRTNIVFGTLCFAVAVTALHYIAIAGTAFVKVDAAGVSTIQLSNELLALLVTVASFVICGGFLLSGATFFPDAQERPDDPSPVEVLPQDDAPPPNAAISQTAPVPVPFERDGATHFIDASEIAAFRAEGHYTIIYHGNEKGFCPWSISEAVKRLSGTPFVRCHRSYLINPAFVSGFERKKDSGIALLEAVGSLEKVPVSRSRLAAVREILGI